MNDEEETSIQQVTKLKEMMTQDLYRTDKNKFLTQVASEVLDELDALPVLLLPELQVTVDARCHDEVRPEIIILSPTKF